MKLPPATEATSEKIPAVGKFGWHDHGRRFGLVARWLLLESDCRLCSLPRHARVRFADFVYRIPAQRSPQAGATKSQKKADVAEHPEVINHAGLLVNEPPGQAGLLFS